MTTALRFEAFSYSRGGSIELVAAFANPDDARKFVVRRASDRIHEIHFALRDGVTIICAHAWSVAAVVVVDRDPDFDEALAEWFGARRSEPVQRIDAVRILTHGRMDGVEVLETGCHSVEEFEALPHAVRFEDRVLGRSAWNSDTGRAYYRSDAAVAAAC